MERNMTAKGEPMRKSGLFVLLFVSALAFSGCAKVQETPKVESAVENETPAAETQVTSRDTGEPSADSSNNKDAGAKISEGPFRGFKIYSDGNAPDNHYVPSGWMGDYGDIKFNDK